MKTAKTKANLLLINVLKAFIIIIIVITAFVLLLNYVPKIIGYKNFVVVTNSMEPTIKVGSSVWVNTNYNIETLKENDIIAFYADANNDLEDEVVIHYIASITKDEFNNYTIRTKREGVTNQVNWDYWQLTSADVLGTYVFQIPYLGKFFLFVDSWFGKIVLIADLLLIYFIIDYLKEQENA